MRTLTSGAVEVINSPYGLEPVVIVRVYWNDTFYDYSDKTDLTAGVFGRILSVGGIDNVISVDGNSTSTSMEVTLDDSDGQLKTIIDYIDVHKKVVDVYQWFEGMSLDDKILLFSGYINTPIEWSEGSRTLKFTIVNLVEDIELGFSLEEGQIPNLSPTCWGKPFPIVFGNTLKVPALRISEPPSGILGTGFSWVYAQIYQKQINALNTQLLQANNQASLYYQAGIGASIEAALYNDGIDNAFSPPDDYSTYLSYTNASLQSFAQSAQYEQQARQIQNQLTLVQEDLAQKQQYNVAGAQGLPTFSYDQVSGALVPTYPPPAGSSRSIPIASVNFPRGVEVLIEINDTRFEAIFSDQSMVIIGEVALSNLRPGQFYQSQVFDQTVTQQYSTNAAETKFKWFDGGAKIRMIDTPVYYVACLGLGPTIVNVYAERQGVRVAVPNDLYTRQNIFFQNPDTGVIMEAQTLIFTEPLTSYLDAAGQAIYDSDDIWCDINSDVGDQFIDILTYIVETFTTLQIDAVSFAEVKALTINNPMAFSILDRTSTYSFIKDLCYQARTAVWIDGTTVKVQYLPVTPDSVATITPDKVIEKSLTITCNATESLVTKLTAKWKATLDQKNYNDIIIRQNLLKYGIHEKTDTYWAYNNFDVAQRTAAFWAIRLSTSWKILKLKCDISMLALESHDGVTLSGFNGMFSTDDVIGVVQSAIFDSDSNTIDLTIWLPIRWGEMDPYVFAWPANITTYYAEPTVVDFFTGNPFYQVRDTGGWLNNVNAGYFSSKIIRTKAAGTAYSISDTPPSYQVSSVLTDQVMVGTRPSGLFNANAKTDMTFAQAAAVAAATADTAIVDIGTVSAILDPLTYSVMTVGATQATTVKLQSIADGYQVTVGTPVTIVKKNKIWYMAPAMWSLENN